MSEEIEIVDGQMYVMCESASDKYIFGKFTAESGATRPTLIFSKKRLKPAAAVKIAFTPRKDLTLFFTVL
ncbi:MAG: hypothetical protein ACLUSP_10480 [Christensenellales bacterium]